MTGYLFFLKKKDHTTFENKHCDQSQTRDLIFTRLV
jgi:hypothetical protein